MRGLAASLPRRFIYTFDLLHELVARDLRLRYKRSVLGIVWTLLNPLAQLLVLHLIFGLLLSLKIQNYTLFLFTGILSWSWFQSSLILATSSIIDNRELIKRPGFPPAVLPLVIVTSHLVHFLLALPILFLFFILGGNHVTRAFLALPLVIALQFTLTLSLAYLVAAFHVTFRDTQYLLGIILQLLFFLTPIFYDVSYIPASYQPFYRLNPMALLIDAFRAIFIRGELPNDISILALGLFSAGLLFFGYIIFTRASYRFVDEL